MTKIKKDTETKYFKEQLMASDKFSKYVDVLSFLLNDTDVYSIKEVEDAIDNYMKKGAK